MMPDFVHLAKLCDRADLLFTMGLHGDANTLGLDRVMLHGKLARKVISLCYDHPKFISTGMTTTLLDIAYFKIAMPIVCHKVHRHLLKYGLITYACIKQRYTEVIYRDGYTY